MKRRKLYEGEAKELVERVKSVASKLIRINRLANSDIKVTATNKEAKAALLKNTE